MPFGTDARTRGGAACRSKFHNNTKLDQPVQSGRRFSVLGSDFDERVHIIEIFTASVHGILQIKAGADGTVQFLEVLAGVPHIPHPGAVDHSSLGDLGQDFFLGLAFEDKAEVDALTGFYQGGQPA